jgi:hypothetical protein
MPDSYHFRLDLFGNSDRPPQAASEQTHTRGVFHSSPFLEPRIRRQVNIRLELSGPVDHSAMIAHEISGSIAHPMLPRARIRPGEFIQCESVLSRGLTAQAFSDVVDSCRSIQIAGSDEQGRNAEASTYGTSEPKYRDWRAFQQKKACERIRMANNAQIPQIQYGKDWNQIRL